jgi:hypothetical protein
VITMPLLEALSRALVDVTLVIGNMGFEPDDGPGQWVANMTQEEWREDLDQRFGQWGPGTTDQVGPCAPARDASYFSDRDGAHGRWPR